MIEEIVLKIVLTIVGFIVTGILGYLVAYFKFQIQLKKSLKCLLRSSITKIYYEYVPKGFIPQYEKENVTYLYTQYKELGGNSYICQIYPEIMNLPIKSN